MPFSALEIPNTWCDAYKRNTSIQKSYSLEMPFCFANQVQTSTSHLILLMKCSVEQRLQLKININPNSFCNEKWHCYDKLVTYEYTEIMNRKHSWDSAFMATSAVTSRLHADFL